MNVFQKIYAAITLRTAVIEADQAHSRTGERYYVMPAGELTQNLIIIDRFNFRKLKQKGYIPRQALISDLERESFYSNSYRDGSKPSLPKTIKQKRNRYYHWCDSVKKARKSKKGIKRMGRYNVKNRQDLQGIATLTNSPTAVESIRKIKHESKVVRKTYNNHNIIP